MDPKKYETEKVKLPRSGDYQVWCYKMRNGVIFQVNSPT